MCFRTTLRQGLREILSNVCLIIIFKSFDALSIAPPRHFLPNPIPHIAFSATFVCNGLFIPLQTSISLCYVFEENCLLIIFKSFDALFQFLASSRSGIIPGQNSLSLAHTHPLSKCRPWKSHFFRWLCDLFFFNFQMIVGRSICSMVTLSFLLFLLRITPGYALTCYDCRGSVCFAK